MTGVFIVFEGGDSVGKSTQVRMLAEWLRHERVDHLVTHEPGDTWLGQKVRELVLSVDSGSISPRAEALLYAADKAQHVDEVVLPALGRGLVVISDRYVDSTLAYQGAGRVLSVHEVEAVARWATHDLRPDLTILLDAAPDVAVSQIVEKDRLEREGEDFHARVRRFFLDLADRDPDHYLVLNARDTRESLARTIRHRVDEVRAQKVSQPSGRVVP